MASGVGSSSGSVNDPSKDPKHKAKSKDPGWKYGYWPNLNDKNLVRCTLCGKDSNAGIKRHKQHLAGSYADVVKCEKTTPEISREMQAALMKNKKRPIDVLDDIVIGDEGERDLGDDEGNTEYDVSFERTPTRQPNESGSGSVTVVPSSGTASKKRKAIIKENVKGAMDAYVLRRNPEEVVDARRSKGPYQTTMENRVRSEEEREKLRSYIASWAYECGIPFNALKARSFEVMVEAIGQYGPGFKPPSFHDYRVPLLKSEKEKTDEIRKKMEVHWKRYGCTLMSDGWTDKRGRHLLNFLVNCSEGTFFLGSVDASSDILDANLLFNLLDKQVEAIGEEYVVQVVTDNASNYVAAGRLLMEKRKKLFWTPCAAHCLDLMLEDIGKINAYKNVIVKARRLTSFIYRHTRLLQAMRTATKGNDLVRAGVTRFASSFLTLQSLLKHKDALRQLFVSDSWHKSSLSTTEKGKRITDTVLATTFWNGVQDCLRASQPILQLLRIVDGDERPALPEVYHTMEETKKNIKKNFGDKERLWKKIINIVDRRWECQMERPIYAAAFFVNPMRYFKAVEEDPDPEAYASKLNEAFLGVMTKLVDNEDLQERISSQLAYYTEVSGSFSRPLAIRQRENEKLTSISWWKQHGSSAPDLSKIAIRLLGLCCSSSGCERNWSTFEFIHTKKRNRLEHERLNDLVYIQYNRRLQVRFQQRREKCTNFNPLVLEDLDWGSEWMTGQSDDEVVHPAGDLTWGEVDRVVGASTSFEGRNRPRRAQASTSEANICYSRRSRDGDEEDVELVEEDVHDDEDVEDDFGLHPPDSANQQQQHLEDFNLDLIAD